MRRPLALAALVILALHPLGANADQDENEQRAFSAGLERFRKGDTRGAIDVWSRLLETLGPERGWRVLYNLGRAYESAGDPTRAIEHFQKFLDVAKNQTGQVAKDSAPAVADAGERVRSIEKAHGVLEVGAPATGVVMVRVGLAEPRPAGFRLYLKPGRHQLTFRPGSAREQTETITIVAGESLARTPEADVTPSTLPAAPPERKERPAPRMREQHEFPTLWVAVGASATVIAGGVSFLLFRSASGKRDDASELGTRHPDYDSAKSEYETAYRRYQFSLVVPAVLGAATATLVLVNLGTKDDARPVSLSLSPAHAAFTGTFQ